MNLLLSCKREFSNFTGVLNVQKGIQGSFDYLFLSIGFERFIGNSTKRETDVNRTGRGYFEPYPLHQGNTDRT